MVVNSHIRLLVFTDLDGTLLDHQTYDYLPAAAMLERLARLQVPVVLASSKTAAEIAIWQDRLGLSQWPAIVENGAAIFDGTIEDGPYRSLCAAIAATGAPFRGFSTMSLPQICDLTGLSETDAVLACQRGYSEPGIWQGSEPALAAFLSQLRTQGIFARQGGRFLTLGYGGTKAGQMQTLVIRFRPELTIALGDAPNDIEMITAADRGIIIRNDHGPGLPPLPEESTGRILRTQASGPAGWHEGMEHMLAALRMA